MNAVVSAAKELRFAAARPARAERFSYWRSVADSLPAMRNIRLADSAEQVTGWPADETTLWAAISESPPFEGWPPGSGEVSHYYLLHDEIRTRTLQWVQALGELGIAARPLPELPQRAVALRAGLGVAGLFGPMIVPDLGSYVAISVIAVRTPPPDEARGAEVDGGHSCSLCGCCIKACPSGAISEQGLDSLNCLRYQIGHQEGTDERHFALMGRRIMGCEECQNACPHNRAVKRTPVPAEAISAFAVETLLRTPDIESIGRLIGKNYAKRRKLQRQAVLAAANLGRCDLADSVALLTGSDYEPLARAAAWALPRLTAGA